MPAIETDDLHQYAVLWEASGVDQYNNPTVLAPVEIRVRWTRARSETVDPHGNTIAVDSKVVVDREIPVHSILWEGRLNDLPDPTVDLERVITKSSIPDTKNQHTRRVLGLSRHSDSLPTIAS